MQVQKNIAWLYWNGMIRTLRPIPVNKIKLVIFDLYMARFIERYNT